MIVEVTPTKKPKTKATTNVINVFIFESSSINIDMLSFKKFLNNLEEQTGTTPTTGTAPTAPAAPTAGNQSSAPNQSSTPNQAGKQMQINPVVRKKLDAAAQKNSAALRLYQTGKTKDAIDTLRKDPNFQLAMQDLTKTNPPANASQLVNVALGGNP
jgi:hypothetical protein